MTKGEEQGDWDKLGNTWKSCISCWAVTFARHQPGLICFHSLRWANAKRFIRSCLNQEDQRIDTEKKHDRITSDVAHHRSMHYSSTQRPRAEMIKVVA